MNILQLYNNDHDYNFNFELPSKLLEIMARDRLAWKLIF